MQPEHRVIPFSSANSAVPAPDVSQLGPGNSAYALSGSSPAILRLWSQIHRVAPYFRAALLTGEPGTGAEAVARALHAASPWRGKALRVLAAPAAEAHFANRSNPALTVGAVYLPEVDRLSAAAQNGLLRQVRTHGAKAGCVTGYARRELRALVSAGNFSADLATALGAVRIALPALRERAEDVQVLLQHALNLPTDAGEDVFGEGFLKAAMEFEWPGNLDQLLDVANWLLAERGSATLTAGDFEAARSVHGSERAVTVMPVRLERLDQLVNEHIRAVLLACGGNKLRAAEVLGISRSTLYRMLDATVPTAMLERTG